MIPAGSYTETDFRDTEIGLIPADWDVVRLGEIAAVRYGKAKPKTDGNIPVLGSSGIYAWAGDILVDFPTIVIGRKGSAGQVWLIKECCWVADTAFYLEWRTDDISIDYLAAYLDLHKLSGEHAQTTMPSLQRPDLENLLVAIPSLPEQRRISDALNTIQDEIAAQEDILSEARAFKRSLMERLFTYGPGEHPAATKETEIGEIPAHWEVDTIGSITESSAFGPRFSGDLYDDLGNVATLRTTDLDDYGHISYSTMPRAQLSLDRYQNHLLQLNDLLITRSGTCGIAAVFDSFDLPVLPGAFLIRFRLNHEVRPVFVRNYINSSAGRPRILQLAGGAVQQNLSSTSLKTFLIPIPPLNEQEEIDDLIADTDAKIAVEEDRKAALQDVFQSALHQLMSGQVRLVG